MFAFGGGSVGEHGLTAARAENQTFEKGIAGQAICAVDASVGGFARCVETGDGSAAPEVGLDSAHHVVRGRANWRHVGGEVEAVAHASGIDTRGAVLQKFGGAVR